jgi:hypothetical protein
MSRHYSGNVPRTQNGNAVIWMTSPARTFLSPMRRAHGLYHMELGTIVNLYAADTSTEEAADNATVILNEENEPQPVCCKTASARLQTRRADNTMMAIGYRGV